MISQMSPTEYVARRTGGEELLLLDVREAQELAIAAVAEAVHIPMAQVPTRLDEIDRDRHVVVLCRSGHRSQAVAGFLQQNGFARVSNLDGGILRWSREVDPSLPVY